jgi:hypothetical protein
MSSLYLGLDVNCQFEAGVLEFDAVYTSTADGGRGYMTISGILASNKQNTASPK